LFVLIAQQNVNAAYKAQNMALKRRDRPWWPIL